MAELSFGSIRVGLMSFVLLGISIAQAFAQQTPLPQASAPETAPPAERQALAQQSPLPQVGQDMHNGVATCSGSTCHGAAEPFPNSSVLQNEFITWQREDRHAKAHDTLRTEESRRIARNLGLQAADTAEICLDCHADNVASDKRGKRFQLSDGVGCEACHGGSQRYLGLHVSGQGSHGDNLKQGMYPTETPIERARLCLSCHFGNDKKFVTHRIMGAGHPRMGFELDTFTDSAPAHFKVDADYEKRKGFWGHAQVWTIGQTIIVQEFLAQLSRPERLKTGLFPELVFFDCHACHHSMDDKRWAPRASVPLESGSVRLNDSSLMMLRQIAQVVDPTLAGKWKQGVKALHEASTRGSDAIISAARQLQSTNSVLTTQIANFGFSQKMAWLILQNLCDEGITGEFSDYGAAEQSLMAIDSLLRMLERAGAADLSSSSELSGQLDALYKALENENTFQPVQYIEGLKNLKSVLSRKQK